MSLYQDLKDKKAKLSLVGLGYVGMPIAHAFAGSIDVIGFDISSEKIRIEALAQVPAMPATVPSSSRRNRSLAMVITVTDSV